MSENHKLTQEEFHNLFDEEVSVKEKNLAVKKIEKRFDYIMQKMGEIIGFTIDWYDYDNAGEDTDTPGYFDSDRYGSHIRFLGKFYYKNDYFKKYQNEFPTDWLKDDFEQVLKKEVAEFKKQQEDVENKKKADAELERQLALELAEKQKQIMEKLTPEERCYFLPANLNGVKNALKKLEQQKYIDEKIKNGYIPKNQRKNKIS